MATFEGPSTVYPSKRDTWLVVTLWVSTAGMFFAGGTAWLSDESLFFRLTMAVIMVSSAALVGSLLYATRYRMTSDHLKIRSGPFVWKVPIQLIREVTPSHSLLSGPALSLDRLHVRYAESSWGILISPADKDGFLKELALRNPVLVRDGDRLVSTSE